MVKVTDQTSKVSNQPEEMKEPYDQSLRAKNLALMKEKIQEWEDHLEKEKSAKKKAEGDLNSVKNKEVLSAESAPIYGGTRLAHLEDTLDPAMRNKMEVIRSEQYRTILVQQDKTFNVGYAMGPGEEKAIQDLLVEYMDVFAWNHFDLTGVNPELGEHRIDLMLGATPMRQRQYRMNPKYSLMVKEEIDRLLEAGFIYPVLHSEWVSPIVIVPKKPGLDGKPKIRVFQDFRKLNEATKKDYYPIPFTNMVLDVRPQEWHTRPSSGV